MGPQSQNMNMIPHCDQIGNPSDIFITFQSFIFKSSNNYQQSICEEKYINESLVEAHYKELSWWYLVPTRLTQLYPDTSPLCFFWDADRRAMCFLSGDPVRKYDFSGQECSVLSIQWHDWIYPEVPKLRCSLTCWRRSPDILELSYVLFYLAAK